MDKSIRKNEICVVGLPRCDFVFSSTRSCFIAYGFDTSTLEMNILKSLLEERGLIAEEAGGTLAPGQSAFCAKICSKIITSQFCVVLLNHDLRNGVETPNANVNMEYGLMLGFNKYVIPFQREGQHLPFNVAGLDTVKYTNQNFRDKAIIALEQAISETTQESVPRDNSDQIIQLFLMERGLLVSAIDSEGDRNLYRLGDSLGFNLLNTFSGNEYVYFGRFTSLRPESVVWRLRKLNSVVSGRRSSLPGRVAQGLITQELLPFVDRLFETMSIMVIVTSDADKTVITEQLQRQPLDYSVELLTVTEIFNEVKSAIPTNA
ncbi:MAG: hypothetical protein H3C64_10130 [Candidatus Kuenenia stuttgartiensis]|uniref:Uncharacterized protein n=1 Tax=Kuenenia stuttgartiensis TaxID=174633 RepID=A0A2C9CJE7_KUEST|nr:MULTISPECIES: hypothetical protein [Kuenenia]MBW7942726.1 hypothetical protein [Candidatus Kuenenia stuttgartiensis]MCZ7611938.1 hypothetical protein [Ignavibacterium sp.]MCZ7620930.1 hypothetical protein [Candidatus Kuenenia sp.]SOH05884.1 hypothetical protein KSMBR1_3410 [Candidatus Kuenenia stuttgartiensis]